MKKMDEMERNIRLRSEALGFKTAILVLAIWTLYECWQSFFNAATYYVLPSLILTVILCVQGFWEWAIKRKMILDDQEYKEPNKILWSIIVAFAMIAIVLSIGSYFLLK